MNTWTPPQRTITEDQYRRTREVTAAFEFGIRYAGTADVETLIAQFLEAAEPQSYLHKVALRVAVRRGYEAKGGVA